jgi:hypothetical protein
MNERRFTSKFEKGYMSILWPRDLVTENAMSTKFEEL